MLGFILAIDVTLGIAVDCRAPHAHQPGRLICKRYASRGATSVRLAGVRLCQRRVTLAVEN
jgi:hypothetical protein